MEDTEGSRSYSSNDEIEAYFKDLDKRFQSKVSLAERKISDINDINEDIFNLNSFEKNEYLIDNIDSKKIDHKAKKRHKKSKKRENYRSRSQHRRCSKRSSSKHSLNSSKTEIKVQDDYFSGTTSKKYNVTSNFDPNSNQVSKIFDFGLESATDKTPKQKKLENRLELFTFPHTEKSPIDSNEPNKIQTTSAYEKSDGCVTLESRKENNKIVNSDDKKEHLITDKNNLSQRPANFLNSESNFIKNEIDLTVSSLSKCFDQKEISEKKDILTEHVLGELINKTNDSDSTKNKQKKRQNDRLNFLILRVQIEELISAFENRD
ncbi:hypothetical protein BpHYR1_000211 [Brachionus plicatilis]|uniref:Uncharacterized protein n=1 Tax=Brachionus plicatilis TaxID=10195 RepID=A0A3M7SD87_BRAPC|nr:hypothetical protein BpHYR1_000211 [Brachionus plicatilis]